MNYDDPLEASVWDDNATSSKMINEISNTFAQSGIQEEPNWGDSDKSSDHESEAKEEHMTSTFDDHLHASESIAEPFHEQPTTTFARDAYSSNPFGETSFQASNPLTENIFATPETTKKSLLNELAPEEDPLAEIKEAAVTETDPLSGALFNDTDRSPLKSDDFSGSWEPKTSIPSSLKAHGTKPNRLFNITRKTALKKNTKMAQPIDQKVFTDPLAKLVEQAEFVDEPLNEDTSTKDQSDSSNNYSKANPETVSNSPQAPKSNLTEKSLPKRPQEQKITEIQEEHSFSEPLYEIEVTDPTKVGDITSSHVEYKVRSKFSDDEHHIVARRYRDFRWLYRQLQNNHWGFIIPPPPDKQILNMFTTDLVETRRSQMSLMLNKIASMSVLNTDPDFIAFLKYDGAKLSTYSKSRNQDTLARSVNDANDLSEVHMSEISLFGHERGMDFYRLSGGADIESFLKKKLKGGGFLTFYAAPTPKYSEPDGYFSSQQDSIGLLKEQLKDIFKALELVQQEKLELASVTKEFALSLNSLIDLDVSVSLTKVYRDFSQVHMNLQESLNRSSQMENLVLGSTVEEHLRTLSSCLAVFNQRQKLGTILVLLEQTIQNMKVSVSKSKGDKVVKQKEELEAFEQYHSTVKQSWKKISETIKSQMASFDKQRIVEFRNSIEIYLESAIESQKEAIEIWETFYQTAL
ncbi:hypothetical protein ACO0QE_004715 [Hanseniaspora vineae]